MARLPTFCIFCLSTAIYESRSKGVLSSELNLKRVVVQQNYNTDFVHKLQEFRILYTEIIKLGLEKLEALRGSNCSSLI